MRTGHTRMMNLKRSISEVYDELRVPANLRLGPLKPDNFKQAMQFAHLSCKASQSRAFLPVLAAVLERPAYRDGTEHNEIRLATVKNLAEAHSIINLGNRCFLTAEEATRLVACVDNFLLMYNCLTHNSIAAGRLCYNQTTKFQYIIHRAQHARFLNPKCF